MLKGYFDYASFGLDCGLGQLHAAFLGNFFLLLMILHTPY